MKWLGSSSNKDSKRKSDIKDLFLLFYFIVSLKIDTHPQLGILFTLEMDFRMSSDNLGWIQKCY